MSNFHDPLDTYTPERKTSDIAFMFSRDMEVEEQSQRKCRYTDSELEQHRKEWNAQRKQLTNANSGTDDVDASAGNDKLIKEREKHTLTVVAIICITLIICTLINSCSKILSLWK